MEYAAVSRIDESTPIRILGTGATREDAKWQAQQWLDGERAYAREAGREPRELEDLQRHLEVLSAAELHDRYHIDLNRQQAESGRGSTVS